MHIVFVFHFSSIIHRLSSIIARLGFGCYLNGERGVGNEPRERENKKMERKPNLNPSLISNFISNSLFCIPILRDRSPFTAARFSNSPLGFSICILNSD